MYKRPFIYFFVVAAVLFVSPFVANAKETTLKHEVEAQKGYVKNVAATHFEITNSDYLNLKIDSSKKVDLQVTSIPEIVMMMISSNDLSKGNNTKLSISGLVPNTTYYRYEDNFHNLTKFTADASGAYVYNQDIKTSHIVFIKPRPSTKYISDNSIGGDCDLIGLWDNDSKTCTLNQTVTETIQIDSNGITLDGNDNYLHPGSSNVGVSVTSKSNVTIKNLHISQQNPIGILVYNSSSVTISHNHIQDSGYDIYVINGSGNTISDNEEISHASYFGIDIDGTTGATISGNHIGKVTDGGNTIDGNSYGLYLSYASWSGSSPNNQITDNVFDGNTVMDIFVSAPYSQYSTACNNSITGNTGTITDSAGTRTEPIGYYNSETTLTSGTFAELILCHADDSNISNVIVGSPTKSVQNDLMHVIWTSGATFSNVNSSGNWNDIMLEYSSSNTFQNTVALNSTNGVGLYFLNSDSNEVNGGYLDHNAAGIILSTNGGGNVFHNLTISNNSQYGGSFQGNNNEIYNNNFVSNLSQVYYVSGSGNVFNLNAPVGGNYWNSNSSCVDNNSDGFCDYPYNFHGSLYDNSPLVSSKSSTVPFLASIQKGSGLKLRNAACTDSCQTDSSLKMLPKDWVVKVTKVIDDYSYQLGENNDGYRWYYVEDQDPADNVQGWMAAGNISGTETYLSYSESDQSSLEAEKATYDESSRPALILKAIDDYYTNSSSTDSLYSSDNGSNNISSLESTYNYPEHLIWGLAAAESGATVDSNGNLDRLDNGNIASDYGHGIMQLTFFDGDEGHDFDNRGVASGVTLSKCSMDPDLYTNCYTDPDTYGNRHYQSYNEVPGAPTYKQYENTYQSIYANIKDGLQKLSASYAEMLTILSNPNDTVTDYGVTFYPSDRKNIIATELYNGDNTDACAHTGAIANRLNNISTYFPSKDLTDLSDISLLIPKIAVATSHNDVCAYIQSPGELSLEDLKGNIVGTVNGKVRNDLPFGIVNQEAKSVEVLMADNTDGYTYKVVGTDTGTYGLVITIKNGDQSVQFHAKGIPTHLGEVHIYSVDKQALLNNQSNAVTVKIDTKGTGKIDRIVRTGVLLDGVAFSAK